MGLEALLIEKTIIVVIVFIVTLTIAAYSTYGERKVAAFIQDRIGPNKAGPFGLMQPLADGMKMLMKEDFVPQQANKFLFHIAPGLSMLTALMVSAVIPWGKTLMIGGRSISVQVTDINIGILYVLSVVSLGVYGIMIGGWASNNKYSLMGALRASSQMISYELPMGLSLIALLMVTGTMSFNEIAAQQSGWNGMQWNIVYQPIGFVLFLVCAFAEANRTPFDLPECEAELVGGYHTEYSSMKLGFFLFAEYAHMFVSSAIISTLYFGGYNFPGINTLYHILPHNIVTLIGIGVLMIKTLFFIFLFMWVRWTIPRFRYDQLMNLGWKRMVPIAIVNIIITAGVVLLFDK
ncbi:MAG: NADH-quinone oxidoreductase subunit NuoH [Chitinophagales bacterium]|nr:NADH-quinone oxidoreductase subunit NuoH [Chitinophagales bacterium]MCZ2392268.1 NADH-quinone oxidoreductase subunit NuoH [Chitinophagales bacterium]